MVLVLVVKRGCLRAVLGVTVGSAATTATTATTAALAAAFVRYVGDISGLFCTVTVRA